MIKIKELDLTEFKNEYNELVKELKSLKDDSTHFELYNKANEFISCFNKLKHEISDLASYSEDENDYFNLKN